jgi:VanZ family protein
VDRLLRLPDIAKRHLLLCLIMAAILYGSLYPFDLNLYDAGQAGLSHLLSTWRNPPQSRGDLIANVLLYMPLGFAVGNASGRKFWPIAVAAIGIGAGLSFSIEWLQYYDQSRVSCLSDFYLNVIGSLVGVLVSQAPGCRLSVISLPEGGRAVFARVLLFAWAAWRLYPYVPTIDLHKYWRSFKPIVLYPDIGAYDVFRFAVLWMGVSHLLRTGVQSKMSPYLLLAVTAGYFCAKVLIVNQSLNLSEIVGATIALLLSRLPATRFYPGVLALLFAVVVVLSRIIPWHLAMITRPFQWVPFYSLLHGSLTVDILAFCEKTFLYGTLLLLLVEAGVPLSLACMGECITLLATSALQTLVAGRSAEITDAVIALLLAFVYLILDRKNRRGEPAC